MPRESPIEQEARRTIGSIDLPASIDVNVEDLQRVRQEIESDGKISLPEVIPRTIILYRERAASVVEKLNALRASPRISAETEEIRRLSQELEYINDRIAIEHGHWLLLLKYVQYQREARLQLAAMQKSGLRAENISDTDKRSVDLRMQEMDGHVQQLMRLMTENAALRTVILHEFSLRQSPGVQTQNALTQAIDAYNVLLPKRGMALKSEVVPGALTTQLTQRRMDMENRLEAALHYSNPAMQTAYELLREYEEAGNRQRRDALRPRLTAFIASPSLSNQERTVKDAMRKLLRLSNPTDQDIAHVRDGLEKGHIEGVVLTSDLLSARIEGLIGSHAFDESGGLTVAQRATLRKELADTGTRVLADLYSFQYLTMRETAGFENIRARYDSVSVSADFKLQSVGEIPHWADRQQKIAIEHADTLLDALQNTPDATMKDRMGSTLYETVIKSGRRLLRNIKSLDVIMKSGDDMKHVPEIMKEDDAAIRLLTEDITLNKSILTRLPSLRGKLASARQAMNLTASEIDALSLEYATGKKRVAEADIERLFADTMDPKDLIVLWTKIDAQTRHDLDLREEASEQLAGDLAHAGTDADIKSVEMRQVEKQMRQNMRAMALELLHKVWSAIYNFLLEELGPEGMIAIAVLLTEIAGRTLLGKSVIGESAKGGYRLLRFGLRHARLPVTTPNPTAVESAISDSHVSKITDAAKSTSRYGRFARALGHVGFIATAAVTAAEIYHQYKFLSQLKEVEDEAERVRAALSFMQDNRTTQTLDLRDEHTHTLYDRSINALTARLDALAALQKIAIDLPPLSVPPEHIQHTATAEEKEGIRTKLLTEHDALATRRASLLSRKKGFQEFSEQVLKEERLNFPIDPLISRYGDGYKVDLGGSGTGFFTGGKLRDAMSQSAANERVRSTSLTPASRIDSLKVASLQSDSARMRGEMGEYMRDFLEYEAAVKYFGNP